MKDRKTERERGRERKREGEREKGRERQALMFVRINRGFRMND